MRILMFPLATILLICFSPLGSPVADAQLAVPCPSPSVLPEDAVVLSTATANEAVSHELAQATLGEDLFLAPVHGTAALHLDVPFSTDVTVTYVNAFGQSISQEVRSRGRYRDLLLTGMFFDTRQPVTVSATWRGSVPQGKAYQGSPVMRTVEMKAGDRRHLQIAECDFEQPTTPLPAALLSIAAAPEPVAAAVSPAKKRPTKRKTARPSGHVFRFEPVPLTAFVAYPTAGTAGGQAESFTFAKAQKTPDLKLVHQPPTLDAKIQGRVTAKITLSLSWEGRNQPVEVILDNIPLEFHYDDAQKRGIAEVDFDGDTGSPPREQVEQAVVAALSLIDKPATMSMTGVIEFGGLSCSIAGAYEISVREGDPTPAAQPAALVPAAGTPKP
jgi:hypothetical protein